jgi:glycosyltransferase involved in cell wall biosynthesis
MQSIAYDIISFTKVFSGYDVVLVLGVAGCIFLPIFRLFFRGKLLVNIDGLEHKRGKWGYFTKRFLWLSEYLAVKFAHKIIVDNKGIRDYVTKAYGKDSELIEYGGDHAYRQTSEEEQKKVLQQYKIVSKSYALAICRIEPENNCHLILEALSRTGFPIVFVGNWEISTYSNELRTRYRSFSNIIFINSLYNLDSLYTLRKNCRFYIHGHSAGGTNPSLVEAMYIGAPVISFDVIYNRETTENEALFFKTASELMSFIDEIENQDLNLIGNRMKMIAEKRYTWEIIAKKYGHAYQFKNRDIY